jgi:Dolichyl-phosphate-mannose-protein mannosyltransferase
MNAIVRAPFVSSTREVLGSLVRSIPLSFRRALVPFLVSRMLIVLLFAGIPLLEAGLAAHWGASDTMSLRLSPGAVADGFAGVAIGNDSAFYYEIASKGYEHRSFDTSKAANWAFFPLHPLLWRAAAALTGEWLWSGVIMANVLSMVALCLLWELARRLTDSERTADNTVLFASFWPSAYFMMLPHTEALFLMLVTASFLAALSRRPWLASIIGGFAGAARANGIFLAPAMLVGRWLRGERRAMELASLLPMGVGLAIFMAYLWAITGNPLAFKDIQVAWGRSFHFPWQALMNVINRPLKIAYPWNPVLIHFGTTVLAMCSVVTCWRKGWRELAVFTSLTLLAPLSTGTLISMTRYIGAAPGVFLALAVWAERRPQFGQLWLAISVCCLTLLCILFTLHINIGGA